MNYSDNLTELIAEAKELANEYGTSLATGHLLIACVDVDNPASFLLSDQKVGKAKLSEAYENIAVTESDEVVERLYVRAERLASRMDAQKVTCFHLLAALMRDRSSQSFEMLERLGVNTSALRTSAMGMATSERRRNGDRAARSSIRRLDDTSDNSEGPNSSLGIHPSLGRRQPESANRSGLGLKTKTKRDTKQKQTPGSEIGEQIAEEDKQAETDLCEDAGFDDKDVKKQQEQAAQSLGERLFDQSEAFCLSAEESPKRSEAEQQSTPKRKTDQTSLAERYEIDPDEFPTLSQFGTNLTRRAAIGQLDPVHSRESEINQLIDVLGKRRTNNPLLVGEPGVGKTAIVEGLANRFVELASQGESIGERAIIELNLGEFTSDTQLRGSLAKRLVALQDEVEGADGDVIIFLDEIHNWVEFGKGSDGPGPAEELKTALARGKFPCIGATTTDEYTEAIEGKRAIERRFETLFVDEPSPEESLDILEQIIEYYEDHHGVDYRRKAVEEAVYLSERYLYEQRLPDKAISVLDLAGSRTHRQSKEVVHEEDIQRVIADIAEVPLERLSKNRSERFVNMESYLQECFVGHTRIVRRVSDIIRRNYAGFQGDRPIGTMLFLGPTGVGKTELVKVLAEFLFHDREAIVRIDMSEFREPHSVSRMVGSPPGYVGHGEGGELTEQVRRRPYQIVLFDEVEKAHPDVLNLLLQLLDEGVLTDGRGRKVDFSQTVVVMTSNLGSEIFEDEVFDDSSERIGFAAQGKQLSRRTEISEGIRKKVQDVAKDYLSPELWNRLDDKFVFEPLNRSEIREIAGLQLDQSREKLRRESGIELEFDASVIDYLIESGGYDPEYGARPMRQTIEKLVEVEVAKRILDGTVSEGDEVIVDVEDGTLTCRLRR